MKTTRVLQTNISETSLDEVSKALNSFVGIRVAICNANTLVRSVKNTKINNIINDFKKLSISERVKNIIDLARLEGLEPPTL